MSFESKEYKNSKPHHIAASPSFAEIGSIALSEYAPKDEKSVDGGGNVEDVEHVDISLENQKELMLVNDKFDMKLLETTYLSLTVDKTNAFLENRLLNRKLVDYHKRKNKHRATLDDDSSTTASLMVKYNRVLDCLNNEISNRHKKFTQCEQRIEHLKTQKSNMVAETSQYIGELEGTFLEIGPTLQSSKNDRFIQESRIERLIKKMRSMRRLLSEQRIKYIRAQDSVIRHEEDIKSIEDLGNGFCINNYEQLHTDNNNLSEKIDERNNELSKICLRLNADTQKVSHIREKEFAIAVNYANEQTKLTELANELDKMRLAVNTARIERDRLRKHHTALIEADKLLEKPNVLRNFDNSFVQIAAHQKTVAHYIQQNRALEQQLTEIMANI